MSDIPADWRGQLNLRAEIARINRDRAETNKLFREADKLLREGEKLDNSHARVLEELRAIHRQQSRQAHRIEKLETAAREA